MKKTSAFFALSVLILALVSALWLSPARKGEREAAQDPVYARVMDRRALRCAYQVWPPFLSKDLNSGKLSGVYYDLFEKLGRDLGLAVEWTEETGAATIFEGLKSGRYDAFCSAITPAAERATAGAFTRPIGYVPFYLYAREDDGRFDNDHDKANSETVTLLTMDGDLSASIIRETFPAAKTISLPNLTNGADVLMGVAAGKADAAVVDSTIARDFIRNNPGKIKQVDGPPVRFPSLSSALPPGEERFRNLLDTALTHYIETGAIDRIFASYGLDETKILRPAAPYKTPDRKP